MDAADTRMHNALACNAFHDIACLYPNKPNEINVYSFFPFILLGSAYFTLKLRADECLSMVLPTIRNSRRGHGQPPP